MFQIAKEHTRGTKYGSHIGHNKHWDFQLSTNFPRMNGSRTTGDNHQKFPGIISSLNRHLANALGHAHIYDSIHPRSGFCYGESQGLCQGLFHNFFGFFLIEFIFPASKKIGVEITQNQISICTCRHFTVPAITNRSRKGTGTLRSHLQ